MEARKLNKKELEELKKQFPLNKQELERLKENKKERLKNKLEILVIVFWIAMLVGVLCLFYLVWNYKFIGVW